MADWVVLPLLFAEDDYQDYAALIKVLLGLISPDVPVNTQIVEWWDEANNRVLVRLTLYQGFHYTLKLVLNDDQVDGMGLLGELNTMLTFMDEPGRFNADDARQVTYSELSEAGPNESWEGTL
ncbi:hypothetical protein ACFLYO_05335 [Chloroflexota bacterium]